MIAVRANGRRRSRTARNGAAAVCGDAGSTPFSTEMAPVVLSISGFGTCSAALLSDSMPS